MPLFEGCCPKIDFVTLDQCRETFDEVCDYIPIVSTISNIIGLVQKHLYVEEMRNNGTLSGRRYYTRLENKDFERYWLLFFPICNIMAAFVLSDEFLNFHAPSMIEKQSQAEEEDFALVMQQCQNATMAFRIPTEEQRQQESAQRSIEQARLFQEEMLGNLDLKITCIPLQERSHFAAIPKEVMPLIYEWLESNHLITFAGTSRNNWLSIHQYIGLLSTRIKLLRGPNTLTKVVKNAFCYCLGSVFGDANLPRLLNEIPHIKSSLWGFCLTPGLIFSNWQGSKISTQDRFLFFLEHASDEDLALFLNLQLQPRDAHQRLDDKDLLEFGDWIVRLLTKERLTRFSPWLSTEDKDKSDAMSNLLKKIGFYLFKKFDEILIDNSATRGSIGVLRVKERGYIIEEVAYLQNCTEEKAREAKDLYNEIESTQFEDLEEGGLISEEEVGIPMIVTEERLREFYLEALRLQAKIKKYELRLGIIDAAWIGLYEHVRGIFSCLYEANPDSTLWASIKVDVFARRYLQAAQTIYLLKKTSFDECSDSETELWELSKQIADCFTYHDESEMISDIKQILLEICHSKELEDENIIQKKLRAFIRAFSFEGAISLDMLFEAIENLGDKFNFDFLIMKELCQHVIPKSSGKVKEVLIWIKEERQVNAYIDYCLGLPMDLQTALISAWLHSSDEIVQQFLEFFSEPTPNSQFLKKRNLDPENYPKLTDEACQEAFNSRNL